jgi:hypothetical protein
VIEGVEVLKKIRERSREMVEFRFCRREESGKVVEEFFRRKRNSDSIVRATETETEKLEKLKEALRKSWWLTKKFKGYDSMDYPELRERLLKTVLPELLRIEEELLAEESYVIYSLPYVYREICVVLTQVRKLPEANVYASAYLETARKIKTPQIQEVRTYEAYTLLANLSLAVNDSESFGRFFAKTLQGAILEKQERLKEVTEDFLCNLKGKEKLHSVVERTELIPVSLPIYLHKIRTPEEIVAEELGVSVKTVREMLRR